MPADPPDAPRRLPLGSRATVVAAYPALRELLAGRGPLLLPTEGATADAPATGTPYLRDVTGVAVGTSGSTGTPKRAVLPAAALRASIEATHERLGGPGRWLLALPARHIAGLQVVLRSLAAGAEPVLLPDGAPFPAGFATAAGRSNVTGRWYTSLVPAQLGPLLDDPEATAALRRFAGVLCGGAALGEPLRARAEAAGISLVATYGMSETAGGCLYDGTPLPGVRVRVDEPDGGIWLGGPTVAAGYLDDPDRSARSFRADADGTRWFGSDDLGAFDAAGRLVVHGRRDDLVNTGGYKVHPAVVETALAALLPPGSQVAVVGLPHPRWGQTLAAAYVPPHGGGPVSGAPGAIDRTEEFRPALRAALPGYAVPQRIVELPALPLIGPGKVERAALARELGTLDVRTPNPGGTMAEHVR